MTKTTNYQLPQWEANDPVRREDFNAAMADIDAGLGGLRLGLDDLWDGLMLHGVERELLEFRRQADAGETPVDPHIFYNKLDAESDAETLTGAGWNQEKHIYMGADTQITLDDIKANSGVSKIGYVRSTPQDYSAYYYFTAPGPAHMTGWSFMLMTYFGDSEGGQMDLQFELRAEKKVGTAWSVLFQSESFPVHTEGTGSVRLWTEVPVDFTIELGAEYRVSLRLAASDATSGSFGFTSTGSDAPGIYGNDIQVSFTPVARTEGSHIRELATAGAHRALVLARCSMEPTEGGVTVLLNGAAADCLYRDGTDRDGGACRELRALVKGPFPEASTLQLDLSCGEADDFRLLDYIVYLL